jgi:hypothetical protein
MKRMVTAMMTALAGLSAANSSQVCAGPWFRIRYSRVGEGWFAVGHWNAQWIMRYEFSIINKNRHERDLPYLGR